MSAQPHTWTDADEGEFAQLLVEVGTESALNANAEETEEDGMKGRRLELMLIRRRAAAPGRPLRLPDPDPVHIESVRQRVANREGKFQLYREAIYEVDWLVMGVDERRQTRRLHLNQPSEVLEAIFNITGCATTAFVTAHNPFGQLLSEEDNTSRHSKLIAEVERQGFRSLPGRGSDPAGIWPSEESLLILGVSRETAASLGQQFEQDAILFSEEDFAPRLVALR